MIRILDVGCGSGSVAQRVFEGVEKEVVRLDINEANKPDVVHDIASPLPENLKGQFDIVIAFHVMEHLDRRAVIGAVRNLAEAVKNRGELWLAVPSLEWVANEILNQHEGSYIQAALYGAQMDIWDYHRCGYTLAALRQLVEISGLIVKKAFQSPFTIVLEGKEYPAIQNMVYGAKYEGLGDPAEAISAPE